MSPGGSPHPAPVVLRPMTPAHLPWASALDRECFGTTGWSVSVFTDELDRPGRRYRVAELADRPVGYAGSALIPDAASPGLLADVQTIAVAPAARGQGIGSLLLADLLSAATEAGAVEVHLEVRVGSPAHGLYTRRGFTGVRRRRDYYGPGQDAEVMVLDLRPSPRPRFGFVPATRP